MRYGHRLLSHPAGGDGSGPPRRADETRFLSLLPPFGRSFASHLLKDDYDIRTVQELLGHKDVKTTMVYTHVVNRGGKDIRSPMDGLPPKAW